MAVLVTGGAGYIGSHTCVELLENNKEVVVLPYVIKDRRPGDIATCYCDPGKAAKELDWKAENGIKEMCEDSWRWQKKNPNGYEG